MSGRTDRERIPFTKKQYGIIFKIALLEAMALALVVPSVTSSGELPFVDQPKELSNILNGTLTISVTSGTSTSTGSVTYSTPYTSEPRVFPTLQGPGGVTNINIRPNVPLAFFQSQPTTQWLSMPTILTEVYGDTNAEHRIEINLAGEGFFRFAVECVNPSNTLGAYLTVQGVNASDPSGWSEINSAQRFLIDNSNGKCPNLGGEHYATGTYSTIPSLFQTTTSVLRIIGVGGGQVGDNPSFAEIWMDYTSSAGGSTISVPMSPMWVVCGSAVTCNTPLDSLKTGFIIRVSYPLNTQATVTLKFTWTAGTIQ